jgi:hypothetical protein
MTAIYKYPVPTPDSSGVALTLMPEDAVVLDFGVQNGQVVVWAEVDPKLLPTTIRQFIIYFTGQPIADDLMYFKTLQLPNGLVIHIYERIF